MTVRTKAVVAWIVLVVSTGSLCGSVAVLNATYGWMPAHTSGNGLKELTAIADALIVIAAVCGLVFLIVWAVVEATRPFRGV